MQDRWPADRVERRKVADLIPYARNARTHSDEQVAQIAASIREWGWTTPVLIDEAGGIIAGHGRVMAARKLGLADVPVMVAAGWSEAQKRAYVLADNKLALNAGWNDELLALELGEIGALGFDLGLTGFGTDEISALSATGTAGLTDPDAVPEPPVDPVTKPGDLWLLGEHRLLCGDSTKAEDVERLMAGAKAVASWADPPYTKDYESRGDKGSCVRSDSWRAILEAAKANRGAAWFVKVPWTDMPTAINELLPDHCIVWAKRGFGLGGKDFRPQHEMILYGRSGGQCHAGDDVGDVWEFPVPFRGRMLHVAETPVALIAKAIGYVTNNIDLVFDPFLGSGTTLIAAEQLGRKCYGMEISPAYCDVIVKRWQDFTGKKARHADTKMTFEEHRDGQAVLRTD